MNHGVSPVHQALIVGFTALVATVVILALVFVLSGF